MNAATIDGLVKSLGKTYDDLVMDGLIPNQPLQALYEGRDRLHMELVPSLSLSFWAETRRFEALFIIQQLADVRTIAVVQAIHKLPVSPPPQPAPTFFDLGVSGADVFRGDDLWRYVHAML